MSQTSFGYDNPLSISPKTLHLGRAQNFYAGIQYELSKNLILDARYRGSKGTALHDTPESIGQNYPDFNTYSKLLTSGHINDISSSPAQAAVFPTSMRASPGQLMPPSHPFPRLRRTTIQLC